MTKKTYFDQVPEALQFCKDVCDNIEKHKIHPNEEFADLGMGILTSSVIDRSGEQVAPKAIESIVQQVNERGLWMNADHDPIIQPIGRILKAQMFWTPDKQTAFVAGALGYFDVSKLPPIPEVPQGSDPFDGVPVDDEWWNLQVKFNTKEIPEATLMRALAGAPPHLTVEVGHARRKSADPITIIEFVLSTYVLLGNPLSKKVLERVGDSAGAEIERTSKDFYRWIRSDIGQRISELRSEKSRLIFHASHAGCAIEFILPGYSVDEIAIACDATPPAVLRACSLAHALRDSEPEAMAYVWHVGTASWRPKWVRTRRNGLLSNQPELVAYEKYSSLSIGFEITDPPPPKVVTRTK